MSEVTDKSRSMSASWFWFLAFEAEVLDEENEEGGDNAGVGISSSPSKSSTLCWEERMLRRERFTDPEDEYSESSPVVSSARLGEACVRYWVDVCWCVEWWALRE